MFRPVAADRVPLTFVFSQQKIFFEKVNKPRKNVRFTVILADGKRFPKIVRAMAGRLISSKGIDAILEQEASTVEKYFPDREFRLVPLSSGDFNFIEMSAEEAELRKKHDELRDQYSEQKAG